MNKKYGLTLLILIAVIGLWCIPYHKPQTSISQININDFCIEEYEFDCITLGLEGCKLIVQCEDIPEKPSKSKQTKAKKKKEGSFKKQVRFFLQLMQEGEIAEAAKYSTQYGLKTFLNFNIDKIEKFKIRQVQADEIVGTAKIKINQLPEKVFYFNKRNNRWTFVGTDDWRG